MKANGRIYAEIAVAEAATGDVVQWLDKKGMCCNRVVGRTKRMVTIQPHLFKRVRRIHIDDVRSCWRWHKKVRPYEPPRS